eukprot:CAMPEP_0118989240 /NCGR_PEP_ID=MMETSP1173-20130426/47647_1 /TAXON_ID=1034831 /ORGANISM="Rhizochromulina marina cf, Strain CCMP1243" /LENGTH=198 /DNA_ID=CAMNT_0006940219 /DNA_START=21 /DNA_END=618 /DNA_ORIENTATION=-
MPMLRATRRFVSCHCHHSLLLLLLILSPDPSSGSGVSIGPRLSASELKALVLVSAAFVPLPELASREGSSAASSSTSTKYFGQSYALPHTDSERGHGSQTFHRSRISQGKGSMHLLPPDEALHLSTQGRLTPHGPHCTRKAAAVRSSETAAVCPGTGQPDALQREMLVHQVLQRAAAECHCTAAPPHGMPRAARSYAH